jgi:hypothetical protein
MKRKLSWVLMVLCLCAGCATRPASEAQVLVSEIVRETPSNVSCGMGDVRYCEVEVTGEQHCTCVDHRALFGTR